MKRLTTLFVSLLVGVTCLAGSPSRGPGRKARLAPDLQTALRTGRSEQRVRVVVNLNHGASGAMLAEINALGGRVQRTFRSLDLMMVDVPLGALESLTQVEGLEYLTPDRPVQGVTSQLEVTTGASLATVPSSGSWSRYGSSWSSATPLDGHGIAIAVIDSGIDADHYDLRDSSGRRALFRIDFAGGSDSDDPFGHGTHVAGIIAGDGSSFSSAGRDYTGMAPDATLIDLRVLDSQGRGTLSRVISAIDFAILYRRLLNIRVLNLSLAAPPIDSYLDDPLCRAVQRAVDAGIVVVAAAGNFGLDPNGNRVYGGISSPGISPAAITVGAVDTRGTDARSDDRVAPWSSRGPTWSSRVDPVTGAVVHDGLAKPDLVAPGVKIVSLERDGNLIVRTFPNLHVPSPGEAANKRYMILSGTSMSAPVVSGAVALMLQANPALTPKQVKAILMYSAQLIDGQDLFEEGAGLLNVDGAVRLAKLIGNRNFLPSLDAAAAGTPVDLDPTSIIAGEKIVWGQGLIWGRGIIGGLAALDNRQDAFASGLIWGISRSVFRFDVLSVDNLFSNDLVVVAQGDSWKSLAASPAASWQGGLMPDAFFSLDSSGLIWGFGRRDLIGDNSLIWGLRDFLW